jgi:hypothetical protein
MRAFLRTIVIAVTVGAYGLDAHAQSSDRDIQAFDKRSHDRIAKHDTAFIELARTYVRNAGTYLRFETAIQQLLPELTARIKANNQSLTQGDIDAFSDAFVHAAWTSNIEIFERWMVAIALETYTPDEIRFLDMMYSTEIGRSVRAKSIKMLSSFGDLNDLVSQLGARGVAAGEARLKELGKSLRP